jgi:hypothetical protein
MPGNFPATSQPPFCRLCPFVHSRCRWPFARLFHLFVATMGSTFFNKEAVEVFVGGGGALSRFVAVPGNTGVGDRRSWEWLTPERPAG